MSPSESELLEAGRPALARGAWAEARAEFGRAADAAPSPEAFEGLGIAARYALDEAAAFTAHEAGYRPALERADRETARPASRFRRARPARAG